MTDPELDRALAFILHQHNGRANAITREELLRRVHGEIVQHVTDDNAQDRKIREGIERLRNAGHLVCNMGGGYFIAATPQEWQAFRALYGSGAFSILRTIGNLDRAAAERWPDPLQERMF